MVTFCLKLFHTTTFKVTVYLWHIFLRVLLKTKQNKLRFPFFKEKSRGVIPLSSFPGWFWHNIDDLSLLLNNKRNKTGIMLQYFLWYAISVFSTILSGLSQRHSRYHDVCFGSFKFRITPNDVCPFRISENERSVLCYLFTFLYVIQVQGNRSCTQRTKATIGAYWLH